MFNGYALDPAALAGTVASYNDYCTEGIDPNLGRPAETSQAENLVPLDTPPYYAVRLMPSIYNTAGGPRKNAKSQAVKPGGVPIPPPVRRWRRQCERNGRRGARRATRASWAHRF